MIRFIVAYMSMGIILGLGFSLLFVRNDKQWISFITSAGSLGCIFAGFILMNSVFDLTSEQKGLVCASYLLGFIGSTVIFFYVFSRVLKTQSEHIKLRILDILLGRSSTLEEYYNDRRQEILRGLSAEEMVRQKSELELSISRNSEILQKINDSEGQTVCFKIMKNSKYPITEDFLRDVPQFIEKWSLFACEVSGLTKDFAEKREKNRGLTRQEFDAYFLALCSAINKILFVNHPAAARSHVRILNNQKGVYQKVVSVEGIRTVTKKPLTDIPVNEGMIFHAFEEKSSLIKSFNPKYHYGTIKSQWYDYLTIPLYDIEANVGDQYFPFISFGIAIQSGYHHEEMLIFLHFMKIEHFIQEQIKMLSNATDIYSAYHGDEGEH